jgi:hypothetical protein
MINPVFKDFSYAPESISVQPLIKPTQMLFYEKWIIQ